MARDTDNQNIAVGIASLEARYQALDEKLDDRHEAMLERLDEKLAVQLERISSREEFRDAAMRTFVKELVTESMAPVHKRITDLEGTRNKLLAIWGVATTMGGGAASLIAWAVEHFSTK